MTQPPLLIALYSSRPQSGKGTVAQYLEQKHNFIIIKCAHPLEKVVYSFVDQFGYNKEQIEFYREEGKNIPLANIPGAPTLRELLRKVGGELRGITKGECWSHLLYRNVERAIKAGFHVVVDDMRFPSEYTELTKLGATMLHLHRDAAVEGNPDSEGLLDDFSFDALLFNNGSKEALYKQVETALEDEKVRRDQP